MSELEQEFNFFGRLAAVDASYAAHMRLVAPRFLFCGGVVDNKDKPIYGTSNIAKQGRVGRVVLVVRDADRKIPLWHIGMNIGLRLCRGTLIDPTRSDAAITYTDYVYDIVYVRNCRVATLSLSPVYEPLVSSATTAQTLEASQRHHTVKTKKAAQPLFPSNATAIIEKVAAARLSQRQFGTFVQMTRDLGVPGDTPAYFANYFSSGRNALQVTHNNSDALEMAFEYGLDAYRAHIMPLSNLDAYARLIAAYPARAQPVRVAFFGAAMPLPPYAQLSANPLTELVGPKPTLTETHSRALLEQCMSLRDLIDDDEESGDGGAVISLGEEDTTSGDAVDESSSSPDDGNEDLTQVPASGKLAATRIVWLAHQMYRAAFFIQRAKAVENEIFDAQNIARLTVRDNRAAEYKEVEKRAALDYMAAGAIWRDIPSKASSFVFGFADGDNQALRSKESWRARPVCTARNWKAALQLVAKLDQLEPFMLLDTNGGASAAYIGSKELLTVLVQCDAVSERQSTGDILWLAACDNHSDKHTVWSLDMLIRCAEHTENAASAAALEMATYHTIVLCDTHLLTQPQWTCAADLLGLVCKARCALLLPRTRVLFCGDTQARGQASTFALLYNSARYYTFKCDNLPLHTPLAFEGAADERRQLLRRSVRNGRNFAAFRTLLLEQLLEPSPPLAYDVCYIPRLPQLADRLCMPKTGQHRFIVLAQWYDKGVRALLKELSETVALMPRAPQQVLASQLAQVAQCTKVQQVLEALVFYAAPFVGFRNQCLRVAAAYKLRSAPRLSTDQLHADNFLELCIDGQSEQHCCISLDDPLLFLELDGGAAGIDHRLCCATRAANLMHVAVHRHELRSQSFVLARDALPLAGGAAKETIETVLCGTPENSGDWFYFDDFYDATITATPFVGQLAIAFVARARLTPMLQYTRKLPRTALSALLASLRE